MVRTVAELAEAIRQHRLLEPEQQDELTRSLQGRFSDPRLLARHLIQQGWLTPYQVNQIFGGKGASLVMGSYIIQERIGEGGMGIVFKARNWKLGRTVALKVIRREHVANNDAVRRFRREIEAVGKLSHPNIVMALDADESSDDQQFFVMEFVEGVNLSALLKEKGPPPVPLACDYVRQVASGLQQAYERGMVHRDIKPANLLVQRPQDGAGAALRTTSQWGPVIKILDMGVARIQQGIDDHDSMSALTKEGRVVGTPDYMAPEQAVNSAKADIRADLYSLGCTFYHLLVGHPPFPGGTPMEKLLKHRIEMPKPLEQARPEVPPAIAGIVRKLMAKKADERYQTPIEVVQAIDVLFPPRAAATQKFVVPQAVRAAAAVPHAVPMGVGVPVAVPVSGPVMAGVPVAQPVGGEAFQFATPTPVRQRGTPPEWPSWLKEALRDRTTRIVIICAVLMLLLGMMVLMVAIVMATSRRRPGTQAPPPDVLTLLVRELTERPTRTPEQRAELRRDLVRFRMQNPGTPQALGAAKYLMQLPSPLDGLRREQVPKREQVAGLPAEVVAVLGEHAQRHWGVVRCVAFSPDGKLVASGGDDNVVRLWDPATMKERAVLTGHGAPIVCLAFGSDSRTLASAAADGTLRLWDQLETQPRLRLEALPIARELHVAAFSPDGKTLAFLSGERTVGVVDVATLKPGQKPSLRATVTAAAPLDKALAFHPIGQTLATAGTDHVVTLWDLSKAQPRVRAALRGHEGAIQALAFSRDGHQLASAAQDQTIRLWANVHTANPVQVRQLPAHEGDQLALAFAPNAQTLVSTGTDRVTRLWDLNGRWGFQGIALTQQPTQWINAVAFASNSQALVTGGQDATVRLWDLATLPPRERFPLRQPAGMASAVAFSPDGRFLATANDGDPLIRVWDLEHDRVALLAGHNGWGYRLDFAPDGRLASAGSFDNVVNIWSLDRLDSRDPDSLPPQVQRIGALGFSPDSRCLATSSMDHMIQLWDVVGPRPSQQRSLVGHAQPVLALAFAPDGKTLASAADDRTIRLWNLDSGRPQHLLTDVQARTLAFAADGRTFASGGPSADGRGAIRLWDVAPDSAPREKRVALVRSHSRPVTRVLFSPDGAALVSAGDDGQLLMHGSASGQLLKAWRFPGAVRDVALAADGRHLATANSNGTVYVLRIRPIPG